MTPICAEVEEEAEANEHIHYDYIEYVKRDESISIHPGHPKAWMSRRNVRKTHFHLLIKMAIFAYS